MFPVEDWKNATRSLPDHTLGRVLRPDQYATRARYDFAHPAEHLMPWVERYWSVHWDLAPGEVFHAATVTEPAINLTYESGGVVRSGQTGTGYWLTGAVKQRRFDVALTGTGSVLGVKLRVGAGPGFGIADPGSLIGQTREAAAWFPDIVAQWRGLGLVAGDRGAGEGEASAAADAKDALDAWLTDRMPARDPGYDRLRDVLAILDDPEVTRLDDVAERAGCAVRTLERLFRAYVGLGPKWLLTRARVIDAVAALDAVTARGMGKGSDMGTGSDMGKGSDMGTDEPLGELAVRLGWFDQAHFTTDFRRIVGSTPQDYRAHSA